MSSNIKVQRICQFCNSEFTARTTVTKYCSGNCGKKANKALKRSEKITASNNETKRILRQPIEILKAKEFLTVQEVSQLLNCSKRTAYYYIENGTIKAVNLGQRMTRVKRSEIDNLFNQSNDEPETKETQIEQFEISDCFNIKEVQNKFGISEKAVYEIIKRNNIPKLKQGWYTYVPKRIINKYLG